MRGGLERDAASPAREQIYRRSVERYCEAERRETLRAHLLHHERMIESHTRAFEEILARHRERVEECRCMLSDERRP